MQTCLRRCFGLALCAVLLTHPGVVLAQNDLFSNLKGDILGGPGGGAENPVSVEAQFTADKDGRTGQLRVTAEIAEDWHIYSITQRKGGPIATKIKLDDGPYKLTGNFKASPPPKKHIDKEAWPGLELQEHEGTVTWTAPIQFDEGVDPTQLEIKGKVNAQACAASCLPPKDTPFTAKWTDESAAAAVPAAPGAEEAGVYRADNVVFRGHLEPKIAVPGGKVKLVVTAEPAKGWHVYELGDKAPETGSHPTLIALTETSGLEIGRTTADVEPHHNGKNAVGEYDSPVTWTTELTVPNSAKPGDFKIAGLVAYQTCLADACRAPTAVRFEATMKVDFNSADGMVPLEFTEKARYAEAADAVAGNSNQLDIAKLANDDAAKKPLWLNLVFGFLGGLILNLMPCVLPVIGLKILSFVEQSGQSRSRVFLLNVWYSLGLLAVFMALATLPVAARLLFNKQFGWGQQFAYDGFNITLAAIVFVMALSFLGVWEIPIPGFVGSGKANELAAHEGFSGAFVKGALTTVLATPCSGPFLGPALGYAVAQPAYITYLMFACIGLGMASPYLLIGAFPQLIRFLPKPGAWMDTFKQAMGFVLMATVVYLMTLVQWERFIPTLALLMGLWAAFWWIGRVPLYAEFSAKSRAWIGGGAFAVLIGLFSFQWLQPVMESRFQATLDKRMAQFFAGQKDGAAAPVAQKNEHELPWEPFSMPKLVEYTKAGKTVMVDFTADWCWTCKTLEATVLNTEPTREYVNAHGIVTMVADMTRYPPEETELLTKLTGPGGQVPVLAIFPSGRPNQPIVLNNGYTRGLLLKKLDEAGPSKQVAVRPAQ